MDIINDIRRQNGFDETDVSWQAQRTIEALQENIIQALLK